MAQVTRTIKKGTDTGRLNRDEVRAVTIALRDGRTDDVVSGRVLREVRTGRSNSAERCKPAANGDARSTAAKTSVRSSSARRVV